MTFPEHCSLCRWAELSPEERSRVVAAFLGGLVAGLVAVGTFFYLKRRGTR